MKLTVYGPLRGATGEKTIDLDTDTDADTVRQVLDAFVQRYPRTETELTDCDGALRPSVRVLVNDEKAALDDPIPDDATVRLFPAMRGG